MSLQTRVTGDPGGLAACARGLRTLAGALHDGSSGLAAASRVSTDEFDGRTADAFTTTTATLAPKVGDLDASVRRFGRAVLAYGDRLGEVQAVMRRARRVGRARGLRVQAGMIHPPHDAAADAAGTDDKLRVYRRLQPIVAGAWAVLAHAEQELKDAAQAADPLEPVERGRRRGQLSGIPAEVRPAARLPSSWPPDEEDWPSDTTAHAPSRSNDPTPAASSEPVRHPTTGRAGARVDVSSHAPPEHPVPALATPPIAPGPPAGLGPLVLDPATLDLPTGWSVHPGADPGVLLSGTAPPSTDGGTPATFEIRAEPLRGNLAVWQAQHVTALGAELSGFSIEDASSFEVEGRSVSWVQFSHTSGEVEVVHQQWAWEADGRAVTLTSAVPADDVDARTGLFERLVRSLNFSSGSSGGSGGSGHRGAGRS